MNPLVTAEAMFAQRSQDPSETSLRQNDARHSIEVLHAIQAMANQLAGFDFHAAPQNQPTLSMAGVEISVRADLLVHGAVRNREQIGVAILRMTQDDADTDAARSRRQDMGFYVATLARLHLEANIESNREPANRMCLSIDGSTARRLHARTRTRGVGMIWRTLAGSSQQCGRQSKFRLTHYPFFNGLAFLALYVVTYSGNEFMKPDD